MKYPIIPFEQPAGTFYLTAIPARHLVDIYKVNPRRYDPKTQDAQGGVQREENTRRVIEIAQYADTIDATFPTAIILALDEGTYSLGETFIELSEGRIADIVDGQHRVKGLERSYNIDEFVLPVVLMLDPTEE